MQLPEFYEERAQEMVKRSYDHARNTDMNASFLAQAQVYATLAVASATLKTRPVNAL